MPATISAKIDPSLLLQIGDMRKAAQIAGDEIKKLERAAAKAQQLGQELDAKSVSRLKRFEAVQDAAKGAIAREKQFNNIEHSVRRTERALKSIRTLVGVETAARIFRNGKVDFADVARIATAGERTVLRVARAMGLGKSASSFIRALPLIGETLHIGAEVLEYAKEREQQSKAAGRAFGSGRTSAGEFNFFQQHNGVFGNPEGATAIAREATRGLIKATPEQRKTIIDAAINAALGDGKSNGDIAFSKDKTEKWLDEKFKISHGGKSRADVVKSVDTAGLSAGLLDIQNQHLPAGAQRKAMEDFLYKTLGHLGADTDKIMQIIADKIKALEESKPAIEKNILVEYKEGIAEKRRAWYQQHHRDFSPNAHFPDTGWIMSPGQHEVSNHGGFERLRQLGVAADVPQGQAMQKFMETNHYSLFNITASRVPSHNTD